MSDVMSLKIRSHTRTVPGASSKMDGVHSQNYQWYIMVAFPCDGSHQPQWLLQESMTKEKKFK